MPVKNPFKLGDKLYYTAPLMEGQFAGTVVFLGNPWKPNDRSHMGTAVAVARDPEHPTRANREGNVLFDEWTQVEHVRLAAAGDPEYVIPAQGADNGFVVIDEDNWTFEQYDTRDSAMEAAKLLMEEGNGAVRVYALIAQVESKLVEVA